ncbi:MAG: sugar ABC transporter permease, partial [Propionibacterium sp.]|nr:sugar ABC transporter permease [Propionibacterium sp.]
MATGTAVPGGKPKIRPGRGQASAFEARQHRLGLILALPAIMYILVFLLFPLLYNMWLSVTNANGGNLISGNYGFNNFENYIEILSDPEFWNALRLSLIFTIACLVLQYIFGFAAALFFRRP